MTKVKMIHSVCGVNPPLDLAGGKEYDLAPELADEFILKGYAEGILSRDYLHDEVVEMKKLDQVVGTGV